MEYEKTQVDTFGHMKRKINYFRNYLVMMRTIKVLCPDFVSGGENLVKT